MEAKWGQLVKGRPFNYAWAYEIVSNFRGGMDVDRLDYFARDAKSMNINAPVDLHRFVNNLRILYRVKD